jgi:hypothetical protein
MAGRFCDVVESRLYVGWRRNLDDQKLDPCVRAKKGNVWEFVKKEDGTYAVIRNGVVLLDSIPEEWRDHEFCTRFGFCGSELDEIETALKKSGRCVLEL